jgi:hypothetical protein
MLSAFLALLISLPFAAVGGRLTEGSWQASALFGVSYYGFVAAVAIGIFRCTVGEERPARRYKLRWWLVPVMLAPFAVFVAAGFLLDSWVQSLQ